MLCPVQGAIFAISEVQDATASLRSEVCNIVAIKPHLQVLFGSLLITEQLIMMTVPDLSFIRDWLIY